MTVSTRAVLPTRVYLDEMWPGRIDIRAHVIVVLSASVLFHSQWHNLVWVAS